VAYDLDVDDLITKMGLSWTYRLSDSPLLLAGSLQCGTDPRWVTSIISRNRTWIPR